MTPTELQQFLRDKLRKAYNFGQTYWQQADSEYRRDHKKADETAAKFAELVENVVLAVKFEMDRAATEAAKATGTAPDTEGAKSPAAFTPIVYSAADWAEDGAQYENRCSNCGIGFFGGKRRVTCKVCAEAARQPAPVVSSDLRNAARLIMDLYDDMRMGKQAIPAFDALRAALAATAAPVLQQYRHIKSGKLYELLYIGALEADLTVSAIYRCIQTGQVWVRPMTEFTEKFELAATRSQP